MAILTLCRGGHAYKISGWRRATTKRSKCVHCGKRRGPKHLAA